jgi:zinc protease
MSFISRCFFLFFLCLFSLSQDLRAQSRAHDLARYHVTELTLKNGMRICLKQSAVEPQEFSFQLVAAGGYASLPVTDQPSAWLAAEIAWESGLDQQTGDELECALDDHSLEMKVQLGLFNRQIEAAGPVKELSYCLQLVRLLFTCPQFNENGLKDALAQARYQLQQKAKANKSIDGEMFTRVNMRNWYIVTPFNPLDLNKIELKKAEQLFKNFFSNPAEFTFILVGDFNSQEVIPLLEESLGSLAASPIKEWTIPAPPRFSEEITKKEFAGITRYKIGYTHLTFPLPCQTSNPLILELLCTILKRRFLAEESFHQQWKDGIKITHQFPLFPYLNPLWLVIKFTSSPSDAQLISQAILKALENIKQIGITEQEIKAAYEELMANRLNASDNDTELFLLANYYQAGWDILHIYTLPDEEKQEKIMLKKVLECYPNLSQYSIISLHP